MRVFMVLCVAASLMAAAAAAGESADKTGNVRDKRGFLGGIASSGWNGGWNGGIEAIPAATVVAVDKVVSVPKVIEVPQLIKVQKVVSVPQIITVNKLVSSGGLGGGSGWW